MFSQPDFVPLGECTAAETPVITRYNPYGFLITLLSPQTLLNFFRKRSHCQRFARQVCADCKTLELITHSLYVVGISRSLPRFCRRT